MPSITKGRIQIVSSVPSTSGYVGSKLTKAKRYQKAVYMDEGLRCWYYEDGDPYGLIYAGKKLQGKYVAVQWENSGDFSTTIGAIAVLTEAHERGGKIKSNTADKGNVHHAIWSKNSNGKLTARAVDNRGDDHVLQCYVNTNNTMLRLIVSSFSSYFSPGSSFAKCDLYWIDDDD